jgi:putative ABC transport system permease protein
VKALDYAKMSLTTFRRTKSRTLLTMLGMIIGVASVIMMLSIGKATERYILSQVASFGSDLITVSNGRGDDATAGGPNPMVKQTLTYDDWKLFRSKDWIRLIAPMYVSNPIVSANGISNFTQTVGTSGDLDELYDSKIEAGRFLEDGDATSYARVVVLGHQVAKDYFGVEDPIGRSIEIARRNFRVVGIMQPGGTKFFSNVDKQIYVPFTTLMRDDGRKYVNVLLLKTTASDMSTGIAETRVLLRDAHNLDNPKGLLSKDDFKVMTQADAMQRAGVIGTILQVLLGAIAGISLVVGGIGIMNIMYISVKERTREIGLRKAIGARGGDLLAQFLVEAVILSVAGGIIGIAIGVIFSWAGISILASVVGGWTYATPWDAIALGFIVSTAIGVIFGYLPARRAAKLQAVEALRYE